MNLSDSNRQRASKRFVILCTAGFILTGADTATASEIFDYPGVPPHSGHISWSAPESAGGAPHFHHHHFHNSTHQTNPPDALDGHEVAHELSGISTSEPDYDPYSVWVNETYMVFDDSTGGTPQQFFSHGFIIEDNQHIPEYEFVGDPGSFSLFGSDGITTFDPRPFIRDAFKLWSDISVDDTHLQMGLAFREVAADGDAAEIRVSFVDFLGDSYAQWFAGSRQLKFARYAEASNTITIKWFTGPVGDYPGAGVDRADLFDTALHEIGHIVGLDHSLDSDDIMTAGSHKAKLRLLSGDDILGARDLYSIPIPEPSALALFGIATLSCYGLMGSRTRRRIRSSKLRKQPSY
jgi:Matrixin